MVTPEYLQMLYAYHARANALVLVAADGLSDAELDQAPITAHDSIRETCVHSFRAEWVWRNRIEGIVPMQTLDAADFPSLASIRTRWEQETSALRDMIDQLSAYDMERSISYSNSQGTPYATPLWQILVHVANHGMQHRSELAAMLTAIGRSPGELDMIGYFRNGLTS
jgi:uncharacterized damage-inducible protein DinB